MTTGLLCPLGSTPNHSPQIPSTRRLQYNNSHGNDRRCPSSYSHGSCLPLGGAKNYIDGSSLPFGATSCSPMSYLNHSHATATSQPRYNHGSRLLFGVLTPYKLLPASFS